MMTNACSSATASPYRGEVALGYWQTLCRALASLGVEMPEQERVNVSRCAVRVEDYLAALEVGVLRTNDFGLRVGASVSLKSFPVLGMTLLSSGQLQQALNQILRYERLNHDLGTSGLLKGPQESHFTWMPNPLYLADPASELSFHLALSVFAGIKTFAPLLIETEIPITRISFVATRPSNASVYQDFFNTDIIYQQPQNAITFASELLDLAVLGGDTSMFATVSSHADRLLLQEENQESVVWKVRSILPEALRMQAFRIEDIATRLNLSARTLQRKLSAAGYRYQTLLDETRQSLAEIYIAENKLSMTEISFLIGYQEQSSFNHAFKAWTGISPGEYRQKLCQQQSGEA